MVIGSKVLSKHWAGVGGSVFQDAKGGGGGVCKLEAVPIEWAPVLGAQETSGGLAGGVLAGTTEQKVEASGCRTD